MTLQDLLDELMGLPLSARTAMVVLKVDPKVAYDVDDDGVDADFGAIVYQQGEVQIEAR